MCIAYVMSQEFFCSCLWLSKRKTGNLVVSSSEIHLVIGYSYSMLGTIKNYRLIFLFQNEVTVGYHSYKQFCYVLTFRYWDQCQWRTVCIPIYVYICVYIIQHLYLQLAVLTSRNYFKAKERLCQNKFANIAYSTKVIT